MMPNLSFSRVGGGGGGGRGLIMDYTGRLLPKGIPFSGFRFKKG